MSTHKNIDRICVVITVLALLITLLFMNGSMLGITASTRSMGYESTLSDTSRVHTIDIILDDWDSFISTASSEEYALCSVVIDNDAVKNVAIRGKGNTSLSTVASMGSERYSLKLEFDHYETGKTYKGLDKLCLNNLIQDNTYMKDYLAYRLMTRFGVDTPLCSYVWVTVNGEDWGLYLAVEAVEDSFTQRVYSGEGDLYKPDSLSMGGGGPGNGMGFNMEDFLDENAEALGFPWDRNSDSGGDTANSGRNETLNGFPRSSGDNSDSVPGLPDRSGAGEDSQPGMSFGDGTSFTGLPDGSKKPGGFGGGKADGTEKTGGFSGGLPGGMGMGSSDVKLQYVDDDPDSYANIFGNAKSAVTQADKARLIRSLKALSEGEDPDEVLDVDELLRYFVVHNYLVNSDSYTGSMVHNYYLHEDDGILSIIPWDYNLAFGTFQAGDASDAVNDPIDTPLSVTGDGSRPLADWIFRSEEYTELYHRYFAEFLDTVDIESMINETCALIAPYVEKDPTAFCTLEEFEAGVAALRSFCEKRTESVRGQLEGTIPSTDEAQQADPASLVNASDLTLSDMGSMGGGKGGFGASFGGSPGDSFGGSFDGAPSDESPPAEQGFPSFDGAAGFGSFPPSGSAPNGRSENGGFQAPSMGNGDFQPPSGSNGGNAFPGSFTPNGTPGMSFPAQNESGAFPWLTVGLSVLILFAGLSAAILYKKRS